jgi:hypothetical protein
MYLSGGPLVNDKNLRDYSEILFSRGGAFLAFLLTIPFS